MIVQMRPKMSLDNPSLTNVHCDAIAAAYMTKLLIRDVDPQELKDLIIDALGKKEGFE